MRILPLAVTRAGGLAPAIAKGYRVLSRGGVIELKRVLLRAGAASSILHLFPSERRAQRDYAAWIARYDTITPAIREKIVGHVATMRNTPLFSIICLASGSPRPDDVPPELRVARQLYSRHEVLHVADSPGEASFSDDLNRALNEARGHFVLLLWPDDELRDHALYWFAASLARDDGADILYADSDRIDEAGRRHDPCFKPDFDCERMLGHPFIGRPVMFRRSLLNGQWSDAGREPAAFEYEFFLNALAGTTASRVRHLPTILAHRKPESRMQHPEADREFAQSMQRAASAFLERKGVRATVEPLPHHRGWQRIRHATPVPEPTVSVVIPTRNGVQLLARCVRGLLTNTDYPSLELLIVDHESDEAESKSYLAALARDPRVRIVPYSGTFNFSAMNNLAAGLASGEVLAFLNNDLQIISAGWLREMVSQAMRPRVGAVGAMLYYPDGTIQHAGLVLSPNGATHIYCNAPRHYRGLDGELLVVRGVSAVTAACMAVRRSVFEEAGGFHAGDLPVAYNDVDLCLRLRSAGYTNVLTPFAKLIHHESATRGADTAPEQRERFRKERDYMERRWGDVMRNDPYLNGNLSIRSVTPVLAEPPGVLRPWEHDA